MGESLTKRFWGRRNLFNNPLFENKTLFNFDPFLMPIIIIIILESIVRNCLCGTVDHISFRLISPLHCCFKAAGKGFGDYEIQDSGTELWLAIRRIVHASEIWYYNVKLELNNRQVSSDKAVGNGSVEF